MQSLTQPPVMNAPYASSVSGATAPAYDPPVSPPVLGPQVPGTASTIAAPQGLSAFTNPLAQQLQSQGRGQDSMLVHMTPGEVGGLQALARAAGGSLTINPHTGLHEAGFLSGLLPMLGGALLTFISGGALSPLMAAGITGAADTAITGSLSKGLMAGLGAFGGASMGGMLAGAGGAAGAGAAGATDAATTVGTGTATTAATTAAPLTLSGGVDLANAANAATLGSNTLVNAAPLTLGSGVNLAGAANAATLGSSAAPFALNGGANLAGAANAALGSSAITAGAAPSLAGAVGTGAGGFSFPTSLGNAADKFGAASRQGLSPGSMFYKAAPMAAGLGVLGSVSSMMQGTPGKGPDTQVPIYRGPYHYAPRTMNSPPPLVMGPNGVYQAPTSEFKFFDPSSPQVLDAQGNPAIYETAPLSKINQYGSVNGYAHGGALPIKDGSFIVDARSVSELGNGSSSAGQELLSRYGGKPLHGPGDGVSDSIHASIGGEQQARVARDEVQFDPEAVSRIGGGNHSEGVKKLYTLMDKARTARKKAKPGQDTKLARGLGSL